MDAPGSASDANSADIDAALFDAPGATAITRLTAVETVRARILLSIEHALLVPGSKLPTTANIAAGLEVSEITARRALEALVDDGFLVRRPGRGGGTFVSDNPPSTGDVAVAAYWADYQAIHRLIDQRSLMESAIVHAAALRATAEQCDQLDDLVEQSQRADTWLEHHLPDTRFHHLVADISGLPEVAVYRKAYEALIAYFVPYPQEQIDPRRDEHRALVQAFRDHDPIAAVSVTREHVDWLRHEMFMALPRES